MTVRTCTLARTVTHSPGYLVPRPDVPSDPTFCPDINAGRPCPGHLEPACSLPARWRVQNHDGTAQQYACTEHLIDIQNRVRGHDEHPARCWPVGS